MICGAPQPRCHIRTNKTANTDQAESEKKREVKQNQPGIVVLSQESKCDYNEHQKRDGYNDLRDNTGKVPPAFKAIETHLKIKKNPDNKSAQHHESVGLKVLREIDSVDRVGVTERDCKRQRTADAQQVGSQYPISNASDFHRLAIGNSKFNSGVLHLGLF